VKVRDVVKLIEKDGWYWIRTKGCHHQYKHPTKPGVVTAPGHPADYLAPGTSNKHLEAGRAEAMKKYLIIVEETSTGFSAYSPDVPGCGSTGKTREEVERNIQQAIEFHLEGLCSEVYDAPEQQSIGALIHGVLEELQWQMARRDEITEARAPSDSDSTEKAAIGDPIQTKVAEIQQSSEHSQENKMSTLKEKLAEMQTASCIEQVTAFEVMFENGDTVLIESQDDPALDRTDPIQKVGIISSAKAAALVGSLQNISIRICPKEGHHPMPHIHIDYGKNRHVASFSIETGERIIGDKTLPYRYDKDIKGWLSKHEDLLLKIWREWKAGGNPAPFIAELRGNA
jgi:predicted RNA binding protein YcfA (HicA-like mRNA interferase family)/predicted RNase H-like HicB family nuclease